jgi:hypothetical protein
MAKTLSTLRDFIAAVVSSSANFATVAADAGILISRRAVVVTMILS